MNDDLSNFYWKLKSGQDEFDKELIAMLDCVQPEDLEDMISVFMDESDVDFGDTPRLVSLYWTDGFKLAEYQLRLDSIDFFRDTNGDPVSFNAIYVLEAV